MFVYTGVFKKEINVFYKKIFFLVNLYFLVLSINPNILYMLKAPSFPPKIIPFSGILYIFTL